MFLDTITTSYNIKNLPTYTSASKFSYSLYYGYDRNIKSFSYGSAHSSGNFSYRYDDLGRLTKSNYFDEGVDLPDLDETIAYDKNGNITSLNRRGTGNGLLSYSYNNAGMSNKLGSVAKNGSGFRSYGYDANGNATSDGMGKGIVYNLLNLPTQITNPSNQVISSYIFSATGEKLRKIGADGNRDYVGGIVYFNGVFEQIQTPEGKATKNGTEFYFVYDLKDHLGNVRVSMDSYNNASRIIQEDEYFSFGLHKLKFDNSNSNKYLYNGKELQEELGQYDYGARFYDPVVGRWNVVDPLAETSRRFSVYTYALDNPIMFVDPDGMQAEVIDGPGPKFKPICLKSYASAYIDSDKDQVGFIKNATAYEKRTSPFCAFMLNLFADLATGLGINAVDNLLFSDENITVAKVGMAALAVVQGLEVIDGAGAGSRRSAYKEELINARIKEDVEVPTAPTSRAARRQAMRDVGIPTSQQPSSQSSNSSGREYTYDTIESWYAPGKKSVQQQTMDFSHSGQPHWEAGKIKLDQLGKPTMNYGRPQIKNGKSKVNY